MDQDIVVGDFFRPTTALVLGMRTIASLSICPTGCRAGRPGSTAKKAVSLGSALLHFALHLLSKNVAEPLVGSWVAHLAVSLADPEPEIRRRVREAVRCLYMLLLCQGGLSGRAAPLVWHLGKGQPWRHRCLNLTRVGEGLGPHLPPSQEAEYLKASWAMVGRLDQEWVRVGGLFLTYSLLGQAYGIMEAEEESNFYSVARSTVFGVTRLSLLGLSSEDSLRRPPK
uniref:Uncharacterized protein n=1 Tax=Sphaerodactylus townsendi TaxID=933632 RepID=A0ACB8F6K6_9SAUR